MGAKVNGNALQREHNDNLGRNRTQRGKICWTCYQAGHGQNNEKTTGKARDKTGTSGCSTPEGLDEISTRQPIRRKSTTKKIQKLDREALMGETREEERDGKDEDGNTRGPTEVVMKNEQKKNYTIRHSEASHLYVQLDVVYVYWIYDNIKLRCVLYNSNSSTLMYLKSLRNAV